MFTVTLHRAGYVSEEAYVDTLKEASEAVRAFQAKHGMGASDMGDFHGEVRRRGKAGISHTVSYNGRVWDVSSLSEHVAVAYDPFASQEDEVG